MNKTAQAFNEWMRRYTEEPARFEADFRTCGEFLAQTAAGVEPTYGETAAAYLDELTKGLDTGAAPPPPAAESSR